MGVPVKKNTLYLYFYQCVFLSIFVFVCLIKSFLSIFVFVCLSKLSPQAKAFPPGLLSSVVSQSSDCQSIHISVFSSMVQSVFVFYNLLSDACLSLFSLLCVSLCVVWLTAEGRPWCPHSFLFGTETSNGALMLAPRCHWAIFCHQTTTGSCHFYSFVLPMATKY